MPEFFARCDPLARHKILAAFDRIAADPSLQPGRLAAPDESDWQDCIVDMTVVQEGTPYYIVYTTFLAGVEFVVAFLRVEPIQA